MAQLPPGKRKEAANLLLGGLSPDQVAKRVGIAKSTAIKIAAEVGVARRSENAQTRAMLEANREALETRKQAVEALRVRVAEKFLMEAGRQLDQLHQPFVMRNIGGSKNTYTEQLVDQPPPSEQRNMMVIAGIAFDKHVKALEIDSHAKQADAASMLSKLTAAPTTPTAAEGPTKPGEPI